MRPGIPSAGVRASDDAGGTPLPPNASHPPPQLLCMLARALIFTGIKYARAAAQRRRHQRASDTHTGSGYYLMCTNVRAASEPSVRPSRPRAPEFRASCSIHLDASRARWLGSCMPRVSLVSAAAAAVFFSARSSAQHTDLLLNFECNELSGAGDEPSNLLRKS